MEEVEKLLLEKVKDKHKRTGGANGLNTYGLAEELNITDEDLREAIEKLLKDKKIAILNHLNGISYTIPK